MARDVRHFGPRLRHRAVRAQGLISSIDDDGMSMIWYVVVAVCARSRPGLIDDRSSLLFEKGGGCPREAGCCFHRLIVRKRREGMCCGKRGGNEDGVGGGGVVILLEPRCSYSPSFSLSFFGWCTGGFLLPGTEQTRSSKGKEERKKESKGRE